MPPPTARRPGRRLSEERVSAYVPADVARQVDETIARTGETRSSWLRRLVVAAVAAPEQRGAA